MDDDAPQSDVTVRAKAWTPAKVSAQAVGLVIGAALLTWAVRLALREENRPALERLREASAQDLVVLGALTLASLLLNAVMFWITLRPLRRAPLHETCAVHVIAAFLTLLPFKLGLLLRAVLHARRHGVTAKQLVAWLAAFGGLSAGTLGTLALVTWLRPTLDGAWTLIAVCALCVLIGVVRLCGIAASHWPWLARVSLGADAIARDWRVVTAHVALRVADTATFGLRFLIAARIAGLMLGTRESLLLGGTYLVLNASAPAGSLGVAEAGTAFLASRVGVDREQAALLALTVTLALALLSGALAIPAWVWLKPHKRVQ